MNFFKSVFSDDPDPESSSSSKDSENEDQYAVPIPTSPMNFFKSIFTDDDPDPKTQEESDSNEDDPDQDSSPNDQNLNSGPVPMNFFKSIFSDDPDPKIEASGSDSPGNEDYAANEDDPDRDSSPDAPEKNNPNLFGGWNFGGLVQSLANKSESVIETYRRDLKEFGSGLKDETKVIRDVASRAVKELPTSIEAGASKAQGSIETVWKGTAQIISQGKEALLAIDHESDSSDTQNYSRDSFNSKQYSRFDARVRKMQAELSTFRDEPDDLDDYQKWKVGFLLEEKGEELERLLEENEDMEEVYNSIVPDEIDHETFWVRYFYKVYKLELADDARVKLLKRAISVEDEEDLSWDVDDDDDTVSDDNVKVPAKLAREIENRELSSEDLKSVFKEEKSVDDKEEKGDEETSVLPRVDSVEKNEVGEKYSVEIVKEGNSFDESPIGKPAAIDEKDDNLTAEDHGSKNTIVDVDSSSENVSNDKSQVDAISESKSDRDDSSKDSSFTVVSNQPSMAEEEDLGWDEIEDLGSGDEKKTSHDGSPSKVDFRKRPTAAEEEEDLSWDIEDDDEPIKA